jgi:hypothetical protein
LVQFLDKRFTLSHFVFFFLSFFLGLDIKWQPRRLMLIWFSW